MGLLLLAISDPDAEDDNRLIRMPTYYTPPTKLTVVNVVAFLKKPPSLRKGKIEESYNSTRQL